MERHRDWLFEHSARPSQETGRHIPFDAEMFEEWRAPSEKVRRECVRARQLTDELLASLTESSTVDVEERERALLLLGRGGTEWGVPVGDLLIGVEIASRKCEAITSLRDVLTAQPHVPHITALLHSCNSTDVLLTTNIVSAEYFLE